MCVENVAYIIKFWGAVVYRYHGRKNFTNRRLYTDESTD